MCTLEKRGSIFILTLTGAGEHRLNPTLLDAIRAALRRVRSEASSALITTAHGKFFSNGYDLAWALQSSPNERRPQIMSSKLREVVADLISLPIPTIAAVTGHASAAGFILALSHDYIVMRKDRGFLYMSEVDIGLKISAWFMALIRCKIGDPATRRDVVLRAMKWTADAALKRGIIHSAHGSAEETVDAAVRLGEELVIRKVEGRLYGETRTKILAEVLGNLGFDETVESRSRL